VCAQALSAEFCATGIVADGQLLVSYRVLQPIVMAALSPFPALQGRPGCPRERHCGYLLHCCFPFSGWCPLLFMRAQRQIKRGCWRSCVAGVGGTGDVWMVRCLAGCGHSCCSLSAFNCLRRRLRRC